MSFIYKKDTPLCGLVSNRQLERSLEIDPIPLKIYNYQNYCQRKKLFSEKCVRYDREIYPDNIFSNGDIRKELKD
ncbi:MAG: hypothetical protein ACFFAK_04230 [Promethearchaeota archaeon]